MGALDRGLAVGVVGKRDLPDPGLARPAGGANISPSSALGSMATIRSA